MSTCAKCGKNARLDTRPNAPHVWIGCDCNPDVPSPDLNTILRIVGLLRAGWLDDYPIAYELVTAAIAGDEPLAILQGAIKAGEYRPRTFSNAPAPVTPEGALGKMRKYMQQFTTGDTPARIQPTGLGPISPAMFDALVATPEPVLCSACGCADFETSLVAEVSSQMRLDMRCKQCGTAYSRPVGETQKPREH